jgi:hypothetical protein
MIVEVLVSLNVDQEENKFPKVFKSVILNATNEDFNDIITSLENKVNAIENKKSNERPKQE